MSRVFLVIIMLGCNVAVQGVQGFDEVHVRLGNAEGARCWGRVEVYQRLQWGTVCSRDWDLRDAAVVCRELDCGFAFATRSGAQLGRFSGEVWWRNVKCSGDEFTLDLCERSPNDGVCSHNEDAGVECTGKLPVPTLSMQTTFSSYSAGEAVLFTCAAPYWRHPIDFHLYKSGVDTPLVTQRAEPRQTRVELTLSELDTSHQGSYSCLYRVQSNPGNSPSSNTINITVLEIHTPQIWYNASPVVQPGWVSLGQSFNVTCFTQPHYPGGTFQLRLIRPSGTVRHSLPAHGALGTFSFASAQASSEGYYCCLYRVQFGGRTFVSRESQPLAISVRGAEPLLSPVVISLLVSGLTFVIATCGILLVARAYCRRAKKPRELERETRTCVDNTYIALTTK
ncbi:uncharacterized protein si:ch211-150o23.3 [Electrophorus electricus]|uniref:Si:ch211-150o23.3 n=1 Tax=Electrophorus electricus TaxID=8005 RepID=A0AAY5ENB1_ELEEL|nr:uncharacterized protein si:ch211-150o23.3 [Electrophorus electricus]XP_035377719.1 uncharacterized protein si:ch211-150o23.3 [Electrophorus electricus]XP_035377720.1 uncharacterized protein si:ch211-150o23.3 [Electrophorus electricus]XP_035377721.1 uncharacterized protein si:ch211-150o23.3 [Electrophorus electricus]